MDEETVEKASAKKEKTVFPGFNPSFKGYSQLPNDWLDEITSQIDNVAELKIVLYVYRHTWGYQEKKNSPDEPAKHDEIKHITTDEFMRGRKKRDGSRMDDGTKLSKHSVIDGLRNAIKHGYILETVDDSDKGRVVKSYALNIIKTDENSCANSAPQECKDCTPDVNNLHSSGATSSHRTEKETKERKREKERMKERERPNVVEENETSDQPATIFHSFTHSIQSSPKPRKMGFIQAPIRDVLKTIGDSQSEKYHFERVHDLWLECDIEDIKVFRDKIHSAKVQATGKDMEHFYQCLSKALK